jgi:hypothetical protein
MIEQYFVEHNPALIQKAGGMNQFAGTFTVLQFAAMGAEAGSECDG